MTKLRLVLAAGVLLALGVAGSAAVAAPSGMSPCPGGVISGSYDGNLTITGVCALAGDLTVDGNLRIARGASLNDHTSGFMITVHGNVHVEQGGVLGLGVAEEGGSHETSFVDGNLVANQPLSLQLVNSTVRGNVISNGGGGTDAAGRNFPIKDNTIGGNLIVQGWQGGWIGVVRSDVGGNVVFANNVALDTSTLPGSDSTEVVTNHIEGNLICHGNTPVAQVGDSGGSPNIVGGNKLGECAGL